MTYTYNIMNLLDGLAEVLSQQGYDIYISNRQQGVTAPCFFITMMSDDFAVEMGRMSMDILRLDIVFLQDPNIVNAMDGVYSVLQFLNENLETIPYTESEQTTLVRTYERSSQIQDLDLHYHITFKNRIYLAETNTKMKTLEDIDVKIKVKQT